MIIYKEAAALKKKIKSIRQSGKTIGYVPTMGALHDGHISLIKASIKNSNLTICSIFVNPTQFNDPKDFEKYPGDICNDILLLEKTGCDILFFPSIEEMYPEGLTSTLHYDLGEIELILEGKYRPGHFQGVCQVVHRFLNIIDPDRIFLGQKDYQQCLVIKRLIKSINSKVQVVIVSTVREDKGLAMSSRNLRLSNEQRRNASGIYKMLLYIKTNYKTFPLAAVKKYAVDYLLENDFHKVDYVSVADAYSLQEVQDVTKSERLVALIAAYIGEVRLIDNLILND